MSEDWAQEIRVRKNTLRLGGHVYQIRNLARVQEEDWTPDLGYPAPAVLRARLALIVATGLLGMVIAGAAAGAGAALLVLAAAGVPAARTAYQLWRLADNRRRHAVIVETCGPHIGVFSTENEGAAHRLFELIVSAIEEPEREFRQQINVRIEGDQINQTANGSGNIIGKILTGK
ncbi:hypothetical protein GCM10010191_86160 [Actinomadura vinacea]|uniref:Uncharacterized protein n=1 Tax=Actinomadura vinacea TaxID=115336 RepID=A0ABN3KAC4_9ACTN